MAEDWPCEAYGPEALQHGARCFLVAQLGARVCPSPVVCGEVMSAERQRVFRLIQELAATGDPVGLLLADDFSSPDQLLGGAGDDD